MTATASPTWRTLSWARRGCWGLMNLCWTSAVHLLGNESCVSGTGGRSCRRSAPLKAQATPRCAGRMRQIHSADARMGERASDEDRVQHVRQIEIGYELSSTGQQAMILATRQRAADENAFGGIVHGRGTG